MRRCAAAAAALGGLGAYAPHAAAQPMVPVPGRPGLSASLSASPPYRCTANVYVDAAHGDDANAGTSGAPWKTLSAADDGFARVPRAGACINVLPGTYHLGKTLIVSHGGDSNDAAGYVVYRSTVPQAAHLVADASIASAGNGDMIMLWAPYVVFDGFDIDGNRSVTRGHGIDGCANGGQPGNIAHHFMAMNNAIHDMGGAGLNTCSADFIAWQHNLIYNTSRTSPYEVSGIDIWAPRALDPGTYRASPLDRVHECTTTILVSGGAHRQESILGALRGGFATILVTDLDTSRWLLSEQKGQR